MNGSKMSRSENTPNHSARTPLSVLSVRGPGRYSPGKSFPRPIGFQGGFVREKASGSASVQKNNHVFPLEEPLSTKVNQTCHSRACIHGVEKEALGLGHDLYGLRLFFGHETVAPSGVLIIDDNVVLSDREIKSQAFQGFFYEVDPFGLNGRDQPRGLPRCRAAVGSAFAWLTFSQELTPPATIRKNG